MTGADPGFEHRGHAEDYVPAAHISTVKSLPIAVQVSLRAQETLRFRSEPYFESF